MQFTKKEIQLIRKIVVYSYHFYIFDCCERDIFDKESNWKESIICKAREKWDTDTLGALHKASEYHQKCCRAITDSMSKRDIGILYELIECENVVDNTTHNIVLGEFHGDTLRLDKVLENWQWPKEYYLNVFDQLGA